MTTETTIITVKYSTGHFHQETWSKTNYFCMECGNQPVWSADDGDIVYYQGAQHMCEKCGFSWNMPIAPKAASCEADEQRWEAIKSYVQIKHETTLEMTIKI